MKKFKEIERMAFSPGKIRSLRMDTPFESEMIQIK
jgi:hypothetical protein